MDSAAGSSELPKRRKLFSIEDIGDDMLFMIFGLLDLIHLVRCSAVCKSWYSVVVKLKYLRVQNMSHVEFSSKRDADPNGRREWMNSALGQLAFKQHASSFQNHARVFQWKGHSVGPFFNVWFKKCRMKRGLILTGVGDDVVRLWSAESCNELEKYRLPDKAAPLVDFDFDATKIVGVSRTRLYIWKRSWSRDFFGSCEGLFRNGLCMSYADPQAVIGCEDGSVHVYDMYSRKTSNIVKMHRYSISCVSFDDEHLLVTGSSHGSISISDLSSDQRVTTLHTDDAAGIRTLCHSSRSHILFTGSSSGYVSCWDLRKRGRLWESRVSPSSIYSVHHLRGDASILAVGGIDGVLRIVDQKNGEVLSRWMAAAEAESRVEAVKLNDDDRIELMRSRVPIFCLSVGMQKIVTVHGDRGIRLWKFINHQPI